MSAWSDWQCGAISEDKYRFYCREEERRDQLEYDRVLYGNEDDEDGEEDDEE